jgi:hypothetical protein
LTSIGGDAAILPGANVYTRKKTTSSSHDFSSHTRGPSPSTRDARRKLSPSTLLAARPVRSGQLREHADALDTFSDRLVSIADVPPARSYSAA